MRPIISAALLAAAVALAAGCGGSSPAAGATAQSTSAAASPSPDPDADACKVLAAMTFDVSTQDKSATTQAQMNAALNLLPKNDAPLGTDTLAAESTLVTLDTDFVGVQFGTAGAAQQYQADASKLDDALQTVAHDCSAHGAAFAVHLVTAQ